MKWAGPDMSVRSSITARLMETWEWGEPSETERVEGSATEFCQVVTQTRNVANTALQITGNTACGWMRIAQCFAGAPEQPPAPSTRFVQRPQ